MKVSKISIEEIFSELDKERIRRRYKLNDEQKLLIAYSYLNKDNPVNRAKFNEIWNKLGYEKIPESTLRNIIRRDRKELEEILNNYLKKNKKNKGVKNGYITGS